MHSSRMRTARTLPVQGGLPDRDPPWTETHSGQRSPPVDRQTPVKILPCPKLRLRVLKINGLEQQQKTVTAVTTFPDLPSSTTFTLCGSTKKLKQTSIK